MMKHLLPFLFIAASTLGVAQGYNFKPDWSKGDKKHITITQTEREFENDLLVSDTVTYNEVKITVLEDNSEDYVIEVLFENQALSGAMELYDRIGEELSDYQDLKLIFSVNKSTAEPKLQNQEEAQAFMMESFDQITEVLKSKAPEEASLIDLLFAPLREIFKNEENIEAYMTQNIGYILTPFNKDFTVGETITKTESTDNPFNPTQQISSTTHVQLESVDAEGRMCTIHEELELDLSGFREMAKQIMLRMMESFGAGDSLATEKANLMDDFDMDVENVKTILFDAKSTWVTRMDHDVTVTSTNPLEGAKTRKEIKVTHVVE